MAFISYNKPTSGSAGADMLNSTVQPNARVQLHQHPTETTLKFRVKIDGLEESPTINIPILGNATPTGFLEWKKVFQRARDLCQWDDRQELAILRLLTSPAYEHITQEHCTAEAAFRALCENFFPKEHLSIYLQNIKRIEYRQYNNVQDNVIALDAVIGQANMCIETHEKICERERYTYFISGLSRSQREKLALHDVETIQQAMRILRKLEGLNEEFREAPEGIREKRGTTIKYCSFHKTSTHSNAECRRRHAQGERTHSREPANRQDRKTSRTEGPRAMVINDSVRPIGKIPVQVHIADKEYQGILDTGANRTFIAERLLSELKDAHVNNLDQPVHLTIANGETMASEQVVDTFLSFPAMGDCEKFDARCYVIRNLPEDVVIGLDFMVRHKTIIDMEDMKIIVSGNEMPLGSGNSGPLSTPDKMIVEKSECYTIQDTKLDEMIQETARKSGDIGSVAGITHKITLRSETPVTSKPYKIPQKLVEGVRAEIDTLMKKSIVRKSISPYASPAFPILKRSGGVRLVVDYRKLNALTEKNQHPLPNIWEQLKDLHGSEIYSQIDLNSGYYQIQMAPEDVEKTAFILPFGHYEFMRMPFGLAGAPMTFQRVMNDLFGHLKFAKVFLDDILIHSKNREEHMEHVKHVLEALQRSNLRINRKKSSFFVDQVEYLGLMISRSGIKASPRHTEALSSMKSPTNHRQAMQVVGLINWFRPFVSNLSTKMARITELTKRDIEFGWTTEHEKDLRKVISEIQAEIRLSHPDFTKRFYLHTDASDVGIGAVLTQNNKIIGFFSKKFTPAQKKYTTSEKEALAIVMSLAHFKSIIFLQPLTIRTDHSNLTFLGSSNLQRAQRWRLLIDEYSPEIVYVKGEENKCADFLSRVHYMQESTEECLDQYPLESQIVARHQKGDQKIAQILQSLREGKESEKHRLEQVWGNQIVKTANNRILVPESLQNHVLEWMHHMLNHPGYAKMYLTLKEIAYWKNMKRDIYNRTRRCRICSRYKSPSKDYGKIQGELSIEEPWATVAVDIYGPIESVGEEEEASDDSQKTYIVSMIDCSTRWPEFAVTRDISAATVSGIVDRVWLCRYPRPGTIITDQGGQFLSEEFKQVTQGYGIRHRTTTAYNPTGNSIVERLHATLGNALRCHPFTSAKEAIDSVAWCMRASYHRALGCTPGELVFGRNMLEPSIEKDIGTLRKAYIRRKKQQAAQDKARDNKPRVEHEYAGKSAYIKEPNPSKLGARWKGPYKVISENRENNTCEVDCEGTIRRVNYRRLKPSWEEEDVVTQCPTSG